MVQLTQWMGQTPAELRRELQTGNLPELTLRRAVVGVSLVGIACMAATTLLQTGIVRDLPDPPWGRFHTKKVNSSDEAYSYGGPDSPITIAAHSINMILATTGGADRARRQPWLPLVASLLATGQASVAAKYLFYQMPKVDRAWCPYCITDALMHFATLALTIPEAARSVGYLWNRLLR